MLLFEAARAATTSIGTGRSSLSQVGKVFDRGQLAALQSGGPCQGLVDPRQGLFQQRAAAAEVEPDKAGHAEVRAVGQPHAVLLEIFTKEGVGTEVVRK